MKKLVVLSLFICFCVCLFAQNINKEEVDTEIQNYIKNGDYANASNLMYNYSTLLYNNNKHDEALRYRIQNCNLIDNHIGYFKKIGLDDETYLYNWGEICLLYSNLKMYNDAIRAYLHILPLLKKNDFRHLLPQYTDYVDLSFSNNSLIEYGDSVYTFQYALDYIKAERPNKELLKQFNSINYFFFQNRYSIAFKDTELEENNVQEILDWHSKNIEYLNNLDKTVFKSEISKYLEYYFSIIHTYAQSISAQKKDYELAIAIYQLILRDLENFKSLNDDIPLDIASVYADMAKNYWFCDKLVEAKIHVDNAYNFLHTEKRNFEYCNICESVAAIASSLGNKGLAANLKYESIIVRDSLGWKPSLSDWDLFMYYNTKDTLYNFIISDSLCNTYGTKSHDMCSIYRRKAQSLSKLMHRSINEQDTILTIALKYRADEAFRETKYIIEKYKKKLEEVGKYNSEKMVLYRSLAEHMARLNELDSALYYSDLAYQFNIKPESKIAERYLYALATHNDSIVRIDLPELYCKEINELKCLLPILGEMEFESFLLKTHIYDLSSDATLFPEFGLAQEYGLNSHLLKKGILLEYSTINNYIEDNPQLSHKYMLLQNLKDSIYSCNDVQKTAKLALDYKSLERDIQLKLIDVQKHNIFVDFQTIKKKLNDNEVAIEFFSYIQDIIHESSNNQHERVGAYIITTDQEYPIFIDLMPKDSLQFFLDYQPKSYKEYSSSFYDKIWGKLDCYINDYKTIYVSPSNLMCLINIEVLEDSTHKPAFEKFNIKRLSSSKQILKKDNQRKQISKVVAFGGIEYKKNSNSIICVLDSLNTRGNWNYLENTSYEVDNIIESFSSKNVVTMKYSGNNATETMFKKLNGQDATILHIATHGFYIPKEKRANISYYSNSNYTRNYQDEMFFSGLILANGTDTWNDSTFVAEADDGILTSYEIAKLDLHKIDIVILSACETGLGGNFMDGIYGLQRAFKKAGVKTILMSLWQIDDKVTTEFMKLFYASLASGCSTDDAYKQALTEIKNKYPDPYFWASFILID